LTETFFAVRGSHNLTHEEFDAHLALAIRLENVAVLLGAGASKAVGGHLMADIWREISSNYADDVAWLRDENLLNDKNDGNVELLLDEIEIACLDGARRRADTSKLHLVRHNIRKAVIRAAILKDELWNNPENAGVDADFLHHRQFFTRLIGNRQPGQAAPWVFTTNYDLAIEWTAEALGVHCVNGFTGLHNRAFRPSTFDLGLRNIQARGEARFGTYNVYLAKLHGSVSWVDTEQGGIKEVASSTLKPKIDNFINSGSPEEWPGLMVFPGATKFVQTTGFIYSEMIRRFTEFLSKPNACLIINGYGFADDHINRLVLSALQNPTLQLIIYLPQLDRIGIYPIASSGEALQPNKQLGALLRAQLPQITVKGYSGEGYFDALARDLPEPALLDETASQARSLEQLLKRVSPVPVSYISGVGTAEPRNASANADGNREEDEGES